MKVNPHPRCVSLEANVGLGDRVEIDNNWYTATMETITGDREVPPWKGAQVVRVAIPQSGLRIVVDEDHWLVRTDAELPFDEQVGLLLSMLMRASERLRGRPLRHVALDTQWILPVEAASWDELRLAYVDAYFTPGVPRGGVDCCIILEDSGPQRHGWLQSGPMLPPQLHSINTQFGHIPNVPEMFVYVRYRDVVTADDSPLSDEETITSRFAEGAARCAQFVGRFLEPFGGATEA